MGNSKEPIFYQNRLPQIGDILTVQRKNAIYIHYGIYVGNNRVVHFSGPVGDDLLNPENSQIRNTSLEDFLRGDPLRIQVIDEMRRKYSPQEVAKRALSCVGQAEVVGGKYNFMLNNCEHFATWCVYGRGESHQIRKLGQMGADVSVIAIDTVADAINFFKQSSFAKRKKREEKDAKKKVLIESKKNENVSLIVSKDKNDKNKTNYCPNCGSRCAEDDNFCRSCGKKLK